MVTKHITGYKRSVIQKKPKKYTPAYNYRPTAKETIDSKPVNGCS